jgi:voltage-gated potassium channel
MTAAGAVPTGAGVQYAALPRRVRRRLVLVCLLRAALTSTLLVVLYYQLPLESRGGTRIGAGLVVGLLVFAGVVAAQVWRITRAEYPLLRAVEALATAVPLFLILFAASYFTMGEAQYGSFSETLDRTDSLYYTITVFSTVGFGDITPKTEPARVVTMVQMLANLLIFGVAARVLVRAVTAGRQSRTGTATAPAGEPGGTIHAG